MTGHKLKTVRTKMGLTQEALAEQLGVTSNTVARWEQGVHSISPIAERLVQVLVATEPRWRKA